jgi:TPP-dependent pyruvate/acetoin dehydrogenase alpha subunit
METTPWDPEGVTVVLGPDGRLTNGSGPGGLDLKAYYKHLVAARCLDLRLARASVPMWASSAGEEAALVAASLVADTDDWIFPGLRDAAVALTRGLDLETLARSVVASAGPQLAGRISSAEHRIGPTCDALGMHLALATGQAHGQKIQGEGHITMALFGEGTTSTGAFHESIMMAVSADLPICFVCRSQLWPDQAPAEAGLVGDSASDRARASGLWSRRVDGADPLAVYAAISAAAERARDGRGPGFVEVVVTQMHRDPPPHRDPVERLRRHLDHTGAWTQTFQDVIEAEITGRLERAFAAVATTEEPS